MTRTVIKIELDLAPAPRSAWWAILAFLLCALPRGAAPAETAVLTDYYPSPAGVYRTLLTTGNTILAEDSGDVELIGPGNSAGMVGVGTTVPTRKTGLKLHVSGNLRVTGCIYLGATKRCAW
ncbi:MAG TPA: hypothetical protein DCM05_00905 [Elusimicrobia bacterium]|nr:hypothetical protein [Elusimicrobiota bacterium]